MHEWQSYTDHATEFTPDGQTTVTCSRSTTNPDGSNAAVPPGDAIPDDPTTANDGSTDGFNAAVPDDFADPAAFPDQSQDEDFDVSYYDSSIHYRTAWNNADESAFTWRRRVLFE